MGKYLEAKLKIDSLKKEQENEQSKFQEKIDEIKEKIKDTERIIDWKRNATSIFKIKDSKKLHIVSLIFDILAIIICILILLSRGVEPKSFGDFLEYIFIIKVFKSKYYIRALMSFLSLIFLFDFVNNLINVILDAVSCYSMIIRKAQLIVTNLAFIITSAVVYNKFNSSMWKGKLNSLPKAFEFIGGDRNSKIVVIALLLVIAISIIAMLVNIGMLIYGIIRDKKLIEQSKQAVQTKAELENELKDAENSMEELLNRQKNELKAANRDAQAEKQKGIEAYNEAIKFDPYDEELIKKAMEYDNPDACYYYCKTVLTNAITKRQNETMSTAELSSCFIELRPYIEIARESKNPTAEYFYVASRVFDSSDNKKTHEWNEFLKNLINAKKNPVFDSFFERNCAILIDVVDETVQEIKAEEERIAREKAEAEKRAKEAEFAKRDIDNWTVSFVRNNPDFCKDIVKEETIFTRQLIKDGKYPLSIAGFDRIFQAFYLFDEARITEVVPYFGVLSFAEGLIFMVKMDDREPSQRRKIARDCFTSVSRIGSGELTERSKILIRAIDSGISFAEFKRKYSPDFPYDVLEYFDKVIKYMW